MRLFAWIMKDGKKTQLAKTRGEQRPGSVTLLAAQGVTKQILRKVL